MSVTVPSAFSGLGYFHCQRRGARQCSRPGRPHKMGLIPFSRRSSQACPPSACPLSGSHFAPCLGCLPGIPKGRCPAWSLVQGVMSAVPIQMPRGDVLASSCWRLRHRKKTLQLKAQNTGLEYAPSHLYCRCNPGQVVQSTVDMVAGPALWDCLRLVGTWQVKSLAQHLARDTCFLLCLLTEGALSGPAPSD